MRAQRSSKAPTGPVLPPDAAITKLSQLLWKQYEKNERTKVYAPVKEVLALLGAGAVVSAALLAPKAAPLLVPLLQGSPDWETWKHYNISYLRRTLARLKQQKEVTITEKDGQQVVQLTKNGKRKILKYSLESLAVEKPKRWDQKWRLVLYDVPVSQKYLGDTIRQTLRAIGFYGIQDSVYIFPYPCFDQIEFLREYYGLGDAIQYMLVDDIERDSAFKIFFGLS